MMTELQQELGYQFSNQNLLRQALTHRSFAADNNERLEFLGDAVLGMVIAEYIFIHFPDAREGQMSRLRSQLVKGETLALIATELKLTEYLRLGAGERKTGGQYRESILENTLEALVGAIYLDADLDAAKACVLRWLQSRLTNLSLDENSKDPKSSLQEYLQSEKYDLPEYQVLATSGAEHEQCFTVACEVKALGLSATAKASSRKKAEQAAASAVFKLLDINP